MELELPKQLAQFMTYLEVRTANGGEERTKKDFEKVTERRGRHLMIGCRRIRRFGFEMGVYMGVNIVFRSTHDLNYGLYKPALTIYIQANSPLMALLSDLDEAYGCPSKKMHIKWSGLDFRESDYSN